MSLTTNIGLCLTGDDEVNMTFLEWRTLMNGIGSNSNMELIDSEIGQLKGDVAAITPDDTTVDGKPWTSKKTVDALCLPFEERGNPVQVYPVEGYPLGVKVSWEPVQEGSGDPSPDNIRPITGRDALSVTRCGKNLWSVGDVSLKQYKEISSSYPAGKYVFSFDVETEATSNIVQIGFCVDGEWKYIQKEKGKRHNINIGANIGITGFRLYAGSGPSYNVNATYKDIQLELGTTATAYEPYTGSTTDIALPETVYGGTLDVETGVVTAEWIFNSIVLGDTSALPDVGDGFVRKNLPVNYTAIIGSSNQKCNVAPYGYDFNGRFTHFYIGDDGYGMIILPVDTPADTVIQTVYRIKAPYTIQLTPEQIAALNGVNTVYTDAGTLTVTGREDPLHTIVTLTDRIAALESAAAGV